MHQGPLFLTAEQFLLTTLIVKLAIMAVTATMVARYRRFRHILIFERRAWPDRLVFSLAIGIPLAAGVVARLLIGYNAASAWRSLAPRKDGKPVAWARAMETLRDALLVAQVADHRELASVVT